MIQLFQHWSGQPIIEVMGWTLLHFIWQGTAVGALLWATLASLGRHRAVPRYALSCLALLVMAALPIATGFILMRETRTLISASFTAISTANHSQAYSVASPRLQVPGPRRTLSTTSTFQTRFRPVLPTLVAAWLLGVSIFLTRLVIGWIHLHAMTKRVSSPPGEWMTRMAILTKRLSLRRSVRLLIARVDVPCTIGWIKPLILIPASVLSGLSVEQLEAILVHELAHIRRNDYLVNLLQTAIEALLFYHPAMWWVSNQIRIAREECCDDIAVKVCGDRAGYVRALSTIEEWRAMPTGLAPAVDGGLLLARIRRLLGNDVSPRPVPSWSTGALVFTALTILAMSIVGVQGCSSSPSNKGTAQPTTKAVEVITAGDLMGLILVDLTPGMESYHRLRVDSAGNLRLPLLGEMKVAGLTFALGESAIVKRYADRGIVRQSHARLTRLESGASASVDLGPIAIGDWLQIEFGDLVPGMLSRSAVEVDESGRVLLPYIEGIKLEGLTEGQAERAIADELIKRKILIDPQLSLLKVARDSGSTPSSKAFDVQRRKVKADRSIDFATDVILFEKEEAPGKVHTLGELKMKYDWDRQALDAVSGKYGEKHPIIIQLKIEVEKIKAELERRESLEQKKD